MNNNAKIVSNIRNQDYLKFRYYDSEIKKLVYSDEWVDIKDKYEALSLFFDHAKRYADGKVDQIIGIKDSKNLDIYEGDLLRWEQTNLRGKKYVYISRFDVTFEMFIYPPKPDPEWGELPFGHDYRNVTIIGNVYSPAPQEIVDAYKESGWGWWIYHKSYEDYLKSMGRDKDIALMQEFAKHP